MKSSFESLALKRRSVSLIKGGLITALLAASLVSSGVVGAQAGVSCDSCVTDRPLLLAQTGPSVVPRGNATVVVVPPGDPRPNGNQLNICCPPNLIRGNPVETKWGTMFEIDRVPGGNATSNYGVKFLPNLAFDQYMATYAQYAGMFVSPKYPNSLGLHAEMRELPAVPSPYVNPITGPTLANWSSSFPLVASNLLRAWWSYFPNTSTSANYPPTGGIWNGPHTPGNVDWKDTFATISPVMNHSSYMKPGRWYMIKLTLKFHSKNLPHGTTNDPSWFVQDVPCFTKYVSFFVNSTVAFKATGGEAPADQLIIREAQ